MRIEPRFLEVHIGDPVEFRCIATGRPEPALAWTGGRDDQLSPDHSFVNGVFRLPAAKKSDEAIYYCKATNSAGSADIRTILYVRGGRCSATLLACLSPGYSLYVICSGFFCP